MIQYLKAGTVKRIHVDRGVWKPSRGNRKRRVDYLIFELATGRL